jgi:ribosomal-protein-serine acetyltransferase
MFSHSLGGRLELRPLELHHAEPLFAVVEANRAYLRQWLGWVDGTGDLSDIEAYIRRSLHQQGSNDGIQAGIWYADELIGVIGQNFIDWHDRKTELGYWLSAGFQGKGMMTRACHAFVDYSLRELRLNRVEILCAAGNLRSRAIPERLGFTQEGTLRQAQWLHDRYVDLVVYAILAEEWQRVSTEKKS